MCGTRSHTAAPPATTIAPTATAASNVSQNCCSPSLGERSAAKPAHDAHREHDGDGRTRHRREDHQHDAVPRSHASTAGADEGEVENGRAGFVGTCLRGVEIDHQRHRHARHHRRHRAEPRTRQSPGRRRAACRLRYLRLFPGRVAHPRAAARGRWRGSTISATPATAAAPRRTRLRRRRTGPGATVTSRNRDAVAQSGAIFSGERIAARMTIDRFMITSESATRSAASRGAASAPARETSRIAGRGSA